MDTKYFAEMLDKKIEVRTMDDLIIGTLKEIDGDVLCIENEKKNGVEKTFVNKTYISMIRMKP
ncbi:MAG: hypothetical protein SO434_08455 [Eubacteriales bacterium]|nr:hypothetical protein [Eubacteriales bacterium]